MMAVGSIANMIDKILYSDISTNHIEHDPRDIVAEPVWGLASDMLFPEISQQVTEFIDKN